MSILFLLAILAAAFAVGLLFRRRGLASARVTEPSCGRCRYCVRGLETFTCPECGSDLREVGILTPGAAKRMRTDARLLIWTGLSIAPSLILAQALAQHITPYAVSATRTRAIFVRAPSTNCAIQVKQVGTTHTIGRPQPNAVIPPQTMTLTVTPGNPANATMTVDLASGEARFSDPAGTTVKGTFDAPFITRWLNAFGLNDPAFSQRAPYIVSAIDEMRDGGGGNFSQYVAPQSGSMHPDVIAHVSTPAVNLLRPTVLGQVMPFLLMGCFWLLGLPFVLRRSRVQSRSDADQA